MTYQSRIADTELEQRLSSAGGVVIEGPRACGKTATARQKAASEVLLDIDEEARVDEGAANLLKFVERVDLDRCGKPSALGVIVSAGYGYVKDGIGVIPIGALGP